MKVVIHFARFGPYHLARLASAHACLVSVGGEAIGLETAGNDTVYEWDQRPVTGIASGGVICAFPGRIYEELGAKETKQGIWHTLDRIRPDAVAIAGWGSVDARACLDWCRANGAKAIVMSETREADGRRIWWKEQIKGILIRRFHGALVGGESHRDYLTKLGLSSSRIVLGYNVVDNAHFATESQKHRITEIAKHRPYFLASNRFIERKNLSRLVEAYGRYAADARVQSPESRIWNLCLLGDGELKQSLIAQCHALGLNVIESAPWEVNRNTDTPIHRSIVFFPGFRQIDELPKFYAHAGCFVHPALEEPWGLVINEAMACGLPVLSGTNIGAAEELVDNGVNGWTFDATSVDSIWGCLQKMAGMDEQGHRKFGATSKDILEMRCPLGAFGSGLRRLLE